MNPLFLLSALALRQVAGPGSDTSLNALVDRFRDRSSKLLHTLQAANAQAWKAVEVSLAGSSWWDRAKRALVAADQKAFRAQVQAFVDSAPLGELPGDPAAFRRECLAELYAARAAGLLPGDEVLDAAALQTESKALARFDDPKALLDAEFAAVGRVAVCLREYGHDNLARLVSLRPPNGRPLIVIAVDYFFRAAVTADPVLSAELQFYEMGRLGGKLEDGLAGLHSALRDNGDKLDVALDLLEETHAVAKDTRDDVRALRDELATDRASLAEVYRVVMELLQRQAAQQAAAPAVAAATAPPPDPGEAAIAEMRAVVEECGTLPAEQKKQHKALFRAVGRLQTTVRAYDAKRRLRKNVLPSAIFMRGTPTPPPEPDAELPFAEPLEEPKPGTPAPGTVNSIFGELPKPKIRRAKPSGGE